MRNFILVLALFLVALSCDRRPQTLEVEAADEALVESTASLVDVPPTAQVEVPKVIKTANYRIQVDNLDSSVVSLEKILARYRGMMADMNQVSTVRELTNTMVIRVPADQFDALLSEIGKEAIYTSYKRVSTQDVSEEFMDIEIRLKTKKEVRDRYIDILKNKAKTVDDVLKAEEQIRVIQEEIEAKEGRLQWLKNRVAFSTINLEMYQVIPFTAEPESMGKKTFMFKVREGLGNGWEMLTLVLLALVNIWPFVVVIGLIYWRRQWIARKLKGNK